jgi:hypothetical protein
MSLPGGLPTTDDMVVAVLQTTCFPVGVIEDCKRAAVPSNTLINIGDCDTITAVDVEANYQVLIATVCARACLLAATGTQSHAMHYAIVPLLLQTNACGPSVTWQVLAAILTVSPDHTPTARILADGIGQLDKAHNHALSRGMSKRETLAWCKVESEKLRMLLAYVRRLKRKSGTSDSRFCHTVCMLACGTRPFSCVTAGHAHANRSSFVHHLKQLVVLARHGEPADGDTDMQEAPPRAWQSDLNTETRNVVTLIMVGHSLRLLWNVFANQHRCAGNFMQALTSPI